MVFQHPARNRWTLFNFATVITDARQGGAAGHQLDLSLNSSGSGSDGSSALPIAPGESQTDGVGGDWRTVSFPHVEELGANVGQTVCFLNGTVCVELVEAGRRHWLQNAVKVTPMLSRIFLPIKASFVLVSGARLLRRGSTRSGGGRVPFELVD